MGIILYFLAGLVCLGLSIAAIPLGLEWWAVLICVGFGIGCVGMGLYKLDEETDCFSNARANRRARKADKIANLGYKNSPLDMVPMMIRAYEYRKENGEAALKKQAVSYITSAYKALWKNWKLAIEVLPELSGLGVDQVKQAFFQAIETVLILVICADDDQLAGDYDVYRKICKKLNKDYTPRTKQEVIEHAQYLYTKNEKGELHAQLAADFIFSSWRGATPARTYEKLVQGFCDLALVDDVVYENEYYILKIFLFDGKIDKYPTNWERFKKEYQ